MDRQQCFDLAVGGLLKQGRKSLAPDDDVACKYRGAGGTKCAIGFLIPDEAYKEEMEYISLRELTDFPGIPLLQDVNADDERFLYELRECHDMGSPDSWDWDYRQVALCWSLETTVLDSKDDTKTP